MLVGDHMTREVFTLTSDATVAEGLQAMNERGVHRFPVLGENGQIIGIASDMDLRIAEAAGRLSDPVSAVMTKRVVTVTEYAPLEEAAITMREKGIGGLPVVRGDKLIGIITDGDIFNVFSQLLGVCQRGLRLTIILPDDHQVIPDLLHEIIDHGGRITALGTLHPDGQHLMIIKVTGLEEEDVRLLIKGVGAEVADVLAQE